MTEAEKPLSVPKGALTYASYLRVDELLSLQAPRSSPAEHDETLFIVIHQVYELWFKQVLHELEHLIARFSVDDAPAVLSTFKRILTIFKTLVAQVDVLETMTPVQFSSFRARLESASGFQSLQFRVLELRAGKRDERMLAHLASDPAAAARIEKEIEKPTLFDAFLGYLRRQSVAVPAALLARAARAPIEESDELRASLVRLYKERNDLAVVCERMVDLDEALQEWRYRHVKMVERTIGFKRGTGGSAGAEYLRQTLFRPLFADLWTIRSEL
ncbi:MAG: tryptophan 2,3-dioxygenase [Deltaproteobacteria bacterium]|nr:tryptophan 2,3-dioxygenase [Deltaproteobacteria bacterium]